MTQVHTVSGGFHIVAIRPGCTFSNESLLVYGEFPHADDPEYVAWDDEKIAPTFDVSTEFSILSADANWSVYVPSLSENISGRKGKNTELVTPSGARMAKKSIQVRIRLRSSSKG